MTVKKFEDFKKESGWEYWECSECHSIYPIYKPKFMKCRYCGSKSISQIERMDYYLKAIDRCQDPEEISDLIRHAEVESDSDSIIGGIRKPHYLTSPNNLNWIGKD